MFGGCSYFLQVGYLYGQYKRINDHVAQRGRGVLWGGTHFYPEVCLAAFSSAGCLLATNEALPSLSIPTVIGVFSLRVK